MNQPELQRRLDKSQTALRQLRAAVPRKEGRHEMSAIFDDVSEPLSDLRAGLQDLEQGIRGFTDVSVEIDNLHEQLIVTSERLAHLVSEESWDGLRWVDVNPRSFRLHLTPLDVADTLKGLFNVRDQAWIFTSATLAIGEDFSHFSDRMGLSDVTGIMFPSPYALENNGLVYLPPGLPPPSDPEHTALMLESVMPLTKMTKGGVFFLFTSHRALNVASKWFKSRRKLLKGRPLLVQGDSPRDDMLRKFREYGNAVLLGTGSFWEGVDVRGPALTIVAIDKLPFASPADPLMMARLEFIRRQGGNGFTEHQLPMAALALKQGAGRLLRDETDFGVIVLCDPRITSKGYGRMFLNCLKPMKSTDSVDEVRQFLLAHQSDAGRSEGRAG